MVSGLACGICDSHSSREVPMALIRAGGPSEQSQAAGCCVAGCRRAAKLIPELHSKIGSAGAQAVLCPLSLILASLPSSSGVLDCWEHAVSSSVSEEMPQHPQRCSIYTKHSVQSCHGWHPWSPVVPFHPCQVTCWLCHLEGPLLSAHISGLQHHSDVLGPPSVLASKVRKCIWLCDHGTPKAPSLP